MNNECKCNKPNTIGINHLRGNRLLSPKCCKPGIFFTTEIIPISMGGSTAGEPFAPKNGMYYNTLVRYAADGGKFIYDSEGNYTSLNGVSPEELDDIIADAIKDLATEEEVDDLQEQINTIIAASDVRDIVGTYADLEAYDTSTLGDNDIIKVLQDETHDGDESYYRWDKPNSTWIYIGSTPSPRTIFYSNSLESGATKHIYKKSDMTYAVSGQDVLEASQKGLVILRMSTTVDPTSYSDTYLINAYVDTSGNDYQFIFSDGVWTYGYMVDDLSNTIFDFSKSQYQNKLTAGTNITISGNVISSKDTTYTAGTNVSISAQNVISATDTTYSDFVGTDGVAGGTAGLVPAPTTSDSGKYLNADGDWESLPFIPTVVQTTGSSTTNVMSQNAVSTIAVGTDESSTIASNAWTTLASSLPYTYQTTITPSYTLTVDTLVELRNDAPVLFATYGFAIASLDVANNHITIYSIGQPDASVTLALNYKEAA